MKKRLKNIVAIVLALAMCFSLGVISASAASSTDYDYELTVINPFCDIYTGCKILFYVETDNPDPSSILLKITYADGSELDGYSSYGVGALEDLGAYCTQVIDGTTFSYQYSWVDGGYLFSYGVSDAGDYIITVYEDDVSTGVSTEVTIQDYDTAYEEWIQEIITESGVDDDSLTDAQKVSKLCEYLFENYKYPTNYEEDGENYLVSLWSEFGTEWQIKQIDSAVAPALVINIATNYLGIDGVVNAYEYSGDYSVHAYVVFEDNYYLPCPLVSSGTINIDSIEMVDVSSIAANNGHHSYDSGTVTKEATCTEDGYVVYICSVCGETVTETIDALGHSYVLTEVETEATCTEDGWGTYVCSVCGDTYEGVIEALGHSWDEGVVTKEAAEDEDGVMTYTCSVCGETYTESIEYVADSEETTTTSDSSAAATGDTNRILLWTVLAAIAIIGAAFTTLKIRFNNR